MTYALILAVCVIAWQAYQLHQRDGRITEQREAHEALVKHLWDSHLSDAQVWANRVQAPDVAVAQTVDPGEMTRQFTMYDDDEDLVKAFKELD